MEKADKESVEKADKNSVGKAGKCRWRRPMKMKKAMKLVKKNSGGKYYSGPGERMEVGKIRKNKEKSG